MKLGVNFRTATEQPLKFGNKQTISTYTLLGMWLLIHAGIYVVP